MSDRSASFARFLVEESRDIPNQHLASVVRDRFPGIPKEEFFRAFEIAEEIAISDAFEKATDGKTARRYITEVLPWL